jgi:putative endonuclease
MNSRGMLAEQYAESWLCKKKLKILSCNYRSRWGEIDIIALDKKTLCFIEVRYRKSDQYGSAIETVTQSKQQRIIRTAQIYLQQNEKYIDEQIRFDVLSLTGNLHDPEIDWHKNAFMMSA